MLTKNVNGADVVMSAQEESDVRAAWAVNIAAVYIPDVLTNYELKYALIELGYMASIQARITAIANANTKAKAQAALDGAAFKRTSPLLIALATQAGLTTANIDNIFVTGKGQEP